MLRVPTAQQRTKICAADAESYLRWLCAAHPGWKIVYHRGALDVDRAQNLTVHLVGKLFAEASRQEAVILHKRRVDRTFEYIARRTDVPLHKRPLVAILYAPAVEGDQR